jgi:hypothetical protein
MSIAYGYRDQRLDILACHEPSAYR